MMFRFTLPWPGSVLARSRLSAAELCRFRNSIQLPFPSAPAVLEVTGRQFHWIVPACPLCKRRHAHGGGLVSRDDPRKVLGHRAAHCIGAQGAGGYILIDSDPEATAKLIGLYA